MTAGMLLRALCEFLRQAVADYAAAKGRSGEYMTPRVYDWDLPVNDSQQSETIDYPFIVARIKGGEDPAEAANAPLLSVVQIDLKFGVCSEEDEESEFAARDGLYDLVNLMEHVRQALQRTPLLDKRYRLERPYKWRIPDEQSYPLWVGFAESTWSVQSVADEQNGGFLHGHAFDWA